MALPATAPVIDIYRGDTTPMGGYRMRGPRPDEATPGPVLNVSTWTWSAQWRDEKDDENFVQLDLALDDTVNGWVFVSMSKEGAEQVNGPGFWDLQATLPDGTRVTKVAGKTKYVADVTR